MIDINERTHKKGTAEFVKSCQIFQVFSVFFLVILAATSLFLAAEIIFTAVGIANVGESSVMTVVVKNVSYIICCIGICISLKFSAAIFGKLKDGETPFRYDIGDKIKAAGITLVVTGIAAFLIQFSCELLLAFDVIADNITMSDFSDTYLCIIGALLCIFSYIFNYGCKLQQESDETL
ncbi:MAG: hypothetical protein ACI4J7_03045 [Ruminiclostridium sp.]